MATAGLLLGIDVGTSATKLVLLDPDGGIVAEASEPAGYASPRVGWAEADADGWWRNVQTGVPRVLAAAGRSANDVAAVGVSGMVPALVLANAEGRVLRPSIQQNDARAVDEIRQIQAQTDAADIVARTGSAVTQQSIGPKLLWVRRHEPDVLARAAYVCGSYDLVVARLTGTWSVERNWALESGLYDLRTETWAPDLLALSKADPAWLPPIRRPSEVVGTVTSGASRLTGLRPGTPVVAGSADHVASAHSAGVIEPGDLLIKLGSAGDVLYCTDRPVVDPRLFLDYHLRDSHYLPNGCMAASGSLIVWFRDTFAPGSTFAQLDAEAAPTPPGADGCILLPYFLGEKTPISDPLARGTLVGLTLSHTRGHAFRAVLEGISYGFRHHLDVLAELGPLPTRARCTNGGARSALWKQITADVLGLPLEIIVDHPGSSLGAAFLAGMGIGAFGRWSDVARFVTVGDMVEPDPAAHARYDALYPLYRETYERLKDLYPRLHAATSA